MQINEQIAVLRKKKGMTQEQLATVLGVTNQSVSKWESGQCCPDIGLLPRLAEYFGVSMDELFGIEAPKQEQTIFDRLQKTPLLYQAYVIATDKGGVSTSILQRRLSIGYQKAKDLIAELISLGYVQEESENGLHRMTVGHGVPASLAHDMQAGAISNLKQMPLADARQMLLSMMFSAHAAYLCAVQNAYEQVDSAVEKVLGGSWGYSAICEPEFTTVMRGQSMFASNNKALDFNEERTAAICALLKTLSDRKNLTVLSVLYALTVHAEDAYADLDSISEKCGLSPEVVLARLEEDLSAHVSTKENAWRIRGESMAVLPIISLLHY